MNGLAPLRVRMNKAVLMCQEKSWLSFLVLMAVAYLAYLPSFDSVWLMDDFPVILENPDIRSLANLWTDRYPGRPLRELSFWFDYQFFGFQSAGYHIQHIFWHGLNAWLLFRLTLRLGFSGLVAWGGTLLFLLHPVQVEVLANISHRKDSLALAFCLLSFLAWYQCRQSRGRMSVGWCVAAAAMWGMALLAKENAIVLPAVILVWESLGWTEALRRRLSLASLVAAMVLVAGRLLWLWTDPAFQGGLGGALSKLGISGRDSFADYLMVAAKGWIVMFRHLLWPTGLSMEYGMVMPTGWSDPWVLGGILWVAILIVGLCGALWRGSLTAVPWAWLLIFWLPTSNLLGFYSYFLADRYWYAPSIGLFLLVMSGVHRYLQSRTALALMLAVVCGVFLSVSWRQQRVWNDELRFYTQMLKVNPVSQEGLLGMADTLVARGELEKAKAYLSRAYLTDVNDGRIAKNMGQLAFRQGRYQQAAEYYTRALQGKRIRRFKVMNDLGSALERQGKYDQAVHYFNKAIELNRDYEPAYTNLGLVYESQGELTKAIAAHRQALSVRPDYGVAYYNLGVALYHTGEKREAFASFERAQKLMKDDGSALYNYASVGIEIGRPEVARARLAELERVNPELAALLRAELDQVRN